ncbi:PA-phosphatase [Belliella marina]|uniref:PA-phosphatase n=1 Tax=Belliella marina TaxID=1644146 RepID=A0ABW4VK21_9BACT
MYRKLFELVSVVFQPLAMPTLIFMFLLFGLPDSEIGIGQANKLLIISVIFANTMIIPIGIIMVMRYTKVIPSLEMENNRERVFPFAVITLLYLITAYAFYQKDWMDYRLIFTMFVISICLILLTSISYFWKISAHMMGVGGLLGIVLAFSLLVQGFSLLHILLPVILLAGLIGSARLYLNAHTPIQVLGGLLLGFGVCFGSFYMVWI